MRVGHMPGGGLTKPAARQPPRHLQRYKCFWSRSILFPIAVILIVRRRCAHGLPIEREGGIPVGNRSLVGDSLNFRHERPSHRRTSHLGDPTHPQRASGLLNAAVERFGTKQPDLKAVANRDRIPL